jgi:hypothetical protein
MCCFPVIVIFFYLLCLSCLVCPLFFCMGSPLQFQFAHGLLPWFALDVYVEYCTDTYIVHVVLQVDGLK